MNTTPTDKLSFTSLQPSLWLRRSLCCHFLQHLFLKTHIPESTDHTTYMYVVLLCQYELSCPTHYDTRTTFQARQPQVVFALTTKPATSSFAPPCNDAHLVMCKPSLPWLTSIHRIHKQSYSEQHHARITIFIRSMLTIIAYRIRTGTTADPGFFTPTTSVTIDSTVSNVSVKHSVFQDPSEHLSAISTGHSQC